MIVMRKPSILLPDHEIPAASANDVSGATRRSSSVFILLRRSHSDGTLDFLALDAMWGGRAVGNLFHTCPPRPLVVVFSARSLFF